MKTKKNQLKTPKDQIRIPTKPGGQFMGLALHSAAAQMGFVIRWRHPLVMVRVKDADKWLNVGSMMAKHDG